ncbi:unnamed protein product [Rhodiola kirilowii]
MENLAEKVDKLQLPAKDHSMNQGCDICKVNEHDANSCPLVQRDENGYGYEEANYVDGNQGREYDASAPQGQNSQSNYTTPRFSLAWKNHTNCSYKTTNPTPPSFGHRPPSNNQAFQPRNPPQRQQYQAQVQKPYHQATHPPQPTMNSQIWTL